MAGLFLIGSLATSLGSHLSQIILSLERVLGEGGSAIAGMLRTTYFGENIHSNAVLGMRLLNQGYLNM